MELKPEMTVGEIASLWPRTIPVLQRHGIDFCCGGSRTIGEACVNGAIPFDTLAGELAAVCAGPEAGAIDWTTEPLSGLVDHIVTRYHRSLDEELPRLTALADKVASVHGAKHPETLPQLVDTFRELSNELSSHLQKEERVLFPHVRDLEKASRGLRPAFSVPFGLASGAIGVMEHEHDDAGRALETIRRLTGGFRPPDDACGSFRALYAGLELFDADLRQHIHLENNILFPRAIAMERTLAGDAALS